MTDPIRLVDRADVPRLISVRDSIDAARDAAIAVSTGQVSTGRMQVSWASGESGTRVMVAALPGLDIFGYKQFHWVGDGVHYACHLFRASDGAPLGVIDAASLTTLRTAATAAVGVESLYGSGRRGVVAVIGSGAEAKAGLRALAAVVDISEARVTSRRPENRDAFASELSAELGFVVVPTDSVRSATDGADVVYSATQSNGPVVYGPQDLPDSLVLATIGSTAPDQREASGEVFANASLVAIDSQDALHESGDLVEATSRFEFDPGSAVLLGALLRSDHSGAESGDLRIFKSIGSAEQDLVLAHTVLRRATESGVGRTVVPATSRKQNI